MIELFQIWALVEILGILCLPLAFTVFRNMPDNGWAFSKALSIIVIAFVVWLPLMYVHFLPFSQLFIAGVVLILAGCSGFSFIYTYRAIAEFWHRNRFYVIVTEIVFAGMLLLLGWLRTFKADIRGFEMFMDEGFVASIMRSTHFPPGDMWFSGHSINYYYYAHYTIAVLAKLLGQSPAVAFNTGIALFFGLTAVNLFGVTCNIVAWGLHTYTKNRITSETELVKPDKALSALWLAIPYGLTSMLMGLVLGNLAATQQWWQNHGVPAHFDWFAPSRVIKDTINEFPAFSFILSCFHAHVLTLAFTILCIGLAFNLFLEPEGKGLKVFGSGGRLLLNICVTAIIVGGLFVMNGWDYPTYMGLMCVCIVVQQLFVYRFRLSSALLLDIIVVTGSLVALSFVFYIPFYATFVSPSLGIGIVSQIYHSQLTDELLIYGLFVFMFLSLMVASVIRRPVAQPARVMLSTPVLVAAGIHPPECPDMHVEETTGSAYTNELSMDGSSVQMGSIDAPVNFAFDIEETIGPAYRDEQVTIKENAEQISLLAGKEKIAEKPHGGIAMRIIPLCLGGYLLASLAALALVPTSATLIIGCCLAVMGVTLALYHIHNRALAFALLLGAAAFTIVAGCEVFFLKDVFDGGSALRMNTVFKFYFQAWSLLSVSSGVGLFFILEGFRSGRTMRVRARWVQQCIGGIWSSLLLVLVLASLVYPLIAPYARYSRVDASHPQPYMSTDLSLDGSAYLATCRQPDCDFATVGDYKAIHWLNEHIQGDPVVVEGSGDDYSYSSRISTFTGLPTLMGWAGHELQWRVNWVKRSQAEQEDFNSRQASIDTIYTNPDSSIVLTTLARYHVQYLYVGGFERSKYSNADLKRFENFMQVVYDLDGVTIFQVN